MLFAHTVPLCTIFSKGHVQQFHVNFQINVVFSVIKKKSANCDASNQAHQLQASIQIPSYSCRRKELGSWNRDPLPPFWQNALPGSTTTIYGRTLHFKHITVEHVALNLQTQPSTCYAKAINENSRREELSLAFRSPRSNQVPYQNWPLPLTNGNNWTVRQLNGCVGRAFNPKRAR